MADHVRRRSAAAIGCDGEQRQLHLLAARAEHYYICAVSVWILAKDFMEPCLPLWFHEAHAAVRVFGCRFSICPKAILKNMGVMNVVTTAIRTRVVKSPVPMSPLASAMLAITSSITPRPLRPMPSVQLSPELSRASLPP